MRLKFKRIKALLTAVTFLFSMVAVNVSATSSTSNDFIGRWEWVEPDEKTDRFIYILEFAESNSVTYTAGWYQSEIAYIYEGNYTVENDALVLKMNLTWDIISDPYMGNGGEFDSSKAINASFSFDFSDDKLTLTHQSGNLLTYIFGTGVPMEFARVGGTNTQTPDDKKSEYCIVINRNTIKDVTDVNGEYYGNLNDIIGAIGDRNYYIDYRNSSAQVNLYEHVVKFNFDNKTAGTTMEADVIHNGKKVPVKLKGYYNGSDILINPLNLIDVKTKFCLPLKKVSSEQQVDRLVISISPPRQLSNITREEEHEKDHDMYNECQQLLNDPLYSNYNWEQGNKKQMLEDFAKLVQDKLGIKKYPVIWESFDGKNGEFRRISDQIVLNENLHYDLFKTVIHECRHAYQWEAIDGINDHKVSEITLEKWENNFFNYKGDRIDWYLGSFYMQPVEFDTHCFANQLIDIRFFIKVIGRKPVYLGSWNPS